MIASVARAALLSAALALGSAQAAAPAGIQPAASVSADESQDPIRSLAQFVEPADLDERIRRITDDPPAPSQRTVLDLLLTLTLVVAALIFISGLDDAFVDAYYWLGGAFRRKRVVESSRLNRKPQAAFAIMVPAWKEHEVIAAMIENTAKTLDYGAFRIFCGVYRNDPATAGEVDRMVARYPDLVTRVDVPHDGPTCKGDCLNHIVRRVLAEKLPRPFAGMVLHDSEDIIHPAELKLFNMLLPGPDLVQLPVLSLDRAWSDLVAGTYMDDFAEAHGKDMAVREALVGRVPGAGVATCYGRRGMEALSRRTGGEPFNTASLTEDYDLSFRLRSRDRSQRFAHVAVDYPGIRAARVGGKIGSVIATHEYFPDRFKAAYRQRARWVLGIAFQEWRLIGWRGSVLERYFLFRDRKAIVMAPVGVLAYLLLLVFALGLAFGSEPLEAGVRSIVSLPALQGLFLANLIFMANRAMQRMYFVGRYYGPMHALMSLVRMPVNNVINFFAVMRAWRLFAMHAITGKRLAWDKTAHIYPDARLLAPARAPAGMAGMLALCFALFILAPQNAAAAPPPLTGRAYELADQAYKAVESGQLAEAMRLASEALQHAPDHPSLILLQADVLSRQGRHAEAAERVRALRPADLDAQGLSQRGYIWLKSGNAAAAEADFSQALGAGGLSPQALGAGGLSPQARANVASELAYLSLRRQDDAAALKWFQTALESPAVPGSSRATLYADAGYAASRLSRNAVAADLLAKAVDEWHAAPEGKKPFDEAALFGMRRTVDTLSRRWGGTFGIGHSATTASGIAAGGDARVVQAGAEVFYTPESFGYRNGRVFQLYANAFQGLYSNDPGFVTGTASQVAGLGARYKPLQDYNLVFALERRLAIGESAGEDDWLARVGLSASSETDWNPARTSWTTWQFYTETAYFIDAGRLIQPFDARIGRTWKLPQWHGAVATPFIGIAGDYDEALTPRTAAGIGPGLALRYWFGESRTRAFSSHFEFVVQYRWRVTDAKRGEGLFGQIAVSF